MVIETPRLALIPLDLRQLLLWCLDLPALEKELGLAYRAEKPEGPFLVIIKSQIEVIKRDPESWLWNTFWLLEERESSVAVGLACFKGLCAGEAEIGYAAGFGYRKKGYVTEAVSALCDWALEQPGVTAVTAETERWNVDSHGVLVRCGFERYDDGSGDTILWWQEKARRRF